MTSSSQLAGKVALITGASRGIGAAVAKRYAREGAQVILLARSTTALEEIDDEIRAAGGKPAVLIPMDLRQHDSIDALGLALFERFGYLDIIVGNAAILGELTPLTHADPDMWQKVMDVNLTANWRLLRSLHPLLAKSTHGRVMMVTSGAAKAAFAYWGAYAASKAGLEMLLRTYAAENARSTIRANLIDPSVVATALRAQAFPSEDASQLKQPDAVTDLFVELALESLTANGHRFSVEA
jgi:NAD(P)-dependent dehydrogenase (short-subunit alcohol dehydrogenase family)